MSKQLGMDLIGGTSLLDRARPPLQPSIASDDPTPPGPYSVGMTKLWVSDTECIPSQPYTIVCGDGRAIAGHVESRARAEAIVAALNSAAAGQ